MTTKTEALKLAKAALENNKKIYKYEQRQQPDLEDKALAAIEALAQQDSESHLQAVSDFGQLQAQPEQEPVATKTEKGITLHVGWDDLPADTKLYTSPPNRQPLTDERIAAILKTVTTDTPFCWRVFARAIEAAHDIKAQS
jgi:hypothetical protein